MTVRRVTIALAKDLSTVPFVYGIEHAESLHADTLLYLPSDCARAFESMRADIALLPVGELTRIKDADIVSSYCIGGCGDMRRGAIVCNCAVEQVERMFFTDDALTQRYYAGILAAKKWGAVKFEQVDELPEPCHVKSSEGCILASTLPAELPQVFAHCYDLSDLWFGATRLPMVHSVWVAHKNVSNAVLDILEEALTYGVEHTWEAVAGCGSQDAGGDYLYLTRNIDYIFDNQKNKALSKFWDAGLKTTLRINPG